LRQQLREAWRQIGELQWQLQAEQDNGRRRDRLLASRDATIAESRDEHEQALADRDQDLADLEDEHQGVMTVLENQRRDAAQRAQPQASAARRQHLGSPRFGLTALVEVLQNSTVQSQDTKLTRELQKWERRVRIALDLESELDLGPAGSLDVETILRRVVARQEADCPGSCVVDVDGEPGLTPRQALLCAWLVDSWLTHTCSRAFQPVSATISVGIQSVETPPEIRIRLSLPEVWGAPDPNLWRETLQPCVTALEGYFDDTSAGVIVVFPNLPPVG
jgi:hypothetical protein